MNKPVSILVEELKQNLIQVINNSGLHISIASLVYDQVGLGLRETSAQVLKQEAVEYKQTKEKEQKEEKASE